MERQPEDPETIQDTLSETEEAELMERARLWLEQILKAIGLETEVRIEADQLEIKSDPLSELQKSCLLSVPPPVNSRSGGSDTSGMGITLDALQFLANTILNLNQPAARQRSYMIELDGYRQRRQQELREMALDAVEQVRASGTEYEFQALSAAERRQLHSFFDAPDFTDLENFSRGKEPDRRLVIRLALTTTNPEAQPLPEPEISSP